ncbi:MAG TPA: hypothetical protein DEG43_03815 [Acidimicrobiaceae bacterium]|nr:hypothetical protein [Acidimicrobiaceae bacterium]
MNLRRAACVTAIAAVSLSCTTPGGSGGGVTPAANPRLMAGCGLDVSFVVDRSGSIGADSVLVAQAGQVLVDLLQDTGSRIKVASFSDTATVHPGGSVTGSTNISDLVWETADSFVMPNLPSAGATNIESGLEVLRRSPDGGGDLTIVFTDGNPNLHYVNLGDGHPGIPASLGSEYTEPIAEANALKAGGTHLLAVGVGAVDAQTLISLSGPNALGGGAAIEDTDYTKITGFEKLADAFGEIARKLCENSLSVLTEFNGSPVFGSVITTTATPTPTQWTQPVGASGPTATDTTSAAAAANFAWRPGASGTQLAVTANPPPGFDPGAMTCEEDLLNGGPRVPIPVTTVSTGSYTLQKVAGSAVFCSVELIVNLELPPVVDVVLSFDLTSSMGSVVQQAKTEATDLINNLNVAAPGTSFTFGVTTYRDYAVAVNAAGCGLTNYSSTYGSGSDYPFLLNQPLTASAAPVQGAINGLGVSGGADGPEAYTRALWELAQPDTSAALGFRPGALKLVVNFSDNVPHDPNLNQGVSGGTWDTGLDLGRNGAFNCGGDDLDFHDDALADMAASGVHLMQVNASSFAAAHWQSWAASTNGGYAQLNNGQSLTQVVIDLLSQL